MDGEANAAPESQHSAQEVGSLFVQQFYHLMQHSPQMVHRFYYQDLSKFSRPDGHGDMILITSNDEINEHILSTEFTSPVIMTVDTQKSMEGGVIVLVTGYFSSENDRKRFFTQTFFLAPQEKGFFVLNDILRIVEVSDHQQGHKGLENGTVGTGAPLAPEHDSFQHQELPQSDEVGGNEEEGQNSQQDGDGLVEKEAAGDVIDEVPNSSQAVAFESNAVTTQEEMPKKTYASIVKLMSASAPVLAQALVRPVPAKRERQASPASKPVPATELPIYGFSGAETSHVQEAEAVGHSIYVKSLPLDASPAQLEEEFKRFGHIKSGGIQVRSNKLHGFCYGFVEFEVASSVQRAIEASPIMIGSQKVQVEEKRTTGARASSRGRLPSTRGDGFRDEGTRGRGSYGGGRGYGRNDFSNRSDFRGRAYSNHGGDVGPNRVDRLGTNVARNRS